jgi:rhomboid-like protein
MRAVRLIISLNIIVYLCWWLMDLQFMADNFLVSWAGLMEGRLWTLLTSEFSHNIFWHIFLNMFVLNSFGLFVEKSLGTKSFFRFYLSAAVISSLGHCIISNFILDAPDIQALGASGAVAGVILLFSLMFPKEKILLFGIIPLPAIWGAILFIGLDVWGLFAQAEGGGLPIGHGAHLGGALTGIIYYFWKRPYGWKVSVIE